MEQMTGENIWSYPWCLGTVGIFVITLFTESKWNKSKEQNHMLMAESPLTMTILFPDNKAVIVVGFRDVCTLYGSSSSFERETKSKPTEPHQPFIRVLSCSRKKHLFYHFLGDFSPLNSGFRRSKWNDNLKKKKLEETIEGHWIVVMVWAPMEGE